VHPTRNARSSLTLSAGTVVTAVALAALAGCAGTPPGRVTASSPGRSSAAATPGGSVPTLTGAGPEVASSPTAATAPARSVPATRRPARPGVSSPEVPRPVRTPSLSSPQCRVEQLRAEAGETQANASTRSTVLQLTNTSRTRCTVTGYGSLALLDSGGRRLTTTPERAAVPAVRKIPLAPNGYTTREISWRVVPTGPQGTVSGCISGRSLLVVPPGSSSGLHVPISITACDRGTLGGGAWTREAG
jgi:hypothetical protein